MTQTTTEARAMTKLAKGDKVAGLGRGKDKMPVGTVTAVTDRYVRVQWDRSGTKENVDRADLLPLFWAEALGRLVTIPS